MSGSPAHRLLEANYPRRSRGATWRLVYPAEAQSPAHPPYHMPTVNSVDGPWENIQSCGGIEHTRTTRADTGKVAAWTAVCVTLYHARRRQGPSWAPLCFQDLVAMQEGVCRCRKREVWIPVAQAPGGDTNTHRHRRRHRHRHTHKQREANGSSGSRSRSDRHIYREANGSSGSSSSSSGSGSGIGCVRTSRQISPVSGCMFGWQMGVRNVHLGASIGYVCGSTILTTKEPPLYTELQCSAVQARAKVAPVKLG